MIESDDVDSIKLLYKLARRTSQQKVFGQCFQDCIEKYVNEEILMKLSPEEERAAKSNDFLMQEKSSLAWLVVYTTTTWRSRG